MSANQNATQARPALHPATRMGPVTLAVSHLSQSVDFYTNVIGLTALPQRQVGGEKDGATMGVGSTPLLHLRELRGARRQPDHSTGLYHVAILVPSRPDLGRVVLNLARTQYPVQGASDHLVSEALYLDDPDGNGLELYRDRPRAEWRWNGDQVVMATEPLDIGAIVRSVEDPDAPFTGMPEGTVIGHVHLRVGDIPKAAAFYNGVIGFDVVAQIPSALFVSAGGYHHHLGMNIWHSRGAPRPPADSVGLREYTIIVPDGEARDQVAARLDSAGLAYTRRDSDLLIDDPWGNPIRLMPESA